jgi:hypothetical protein
MRAVAIFLSALGVGIALFAAPATAQTAPWLQVPPNKKDAVPALAIDDEDGRILRVTPG